jgi:hypothetical protein
VALAPREASGVDEVKYKAQELDQATLQLQAIAGAEGGEASCVALLKPCSRKRILPSFAQALSRGWRRHSARGPVQWAAASRAGGEIFEPRAVVDIELTLASEVSETRPGDQARRGRGQRRLRRRDHLGAGSAGVRDLIEEHHGRQRHRRNRHRHRERWTVARGFGLLRSSSRMTRRSSTCYRVYEDASDAVTDGFAVGLADGRALSKIFSQNPKPPLAAVGRATAR